MDTRRCHTLAPGPDDLFGPVVYWMLREHRASDSWPLLHAIEQANSRRVPLHVALCLTPEMPGLSQRQARFMIDGLREVEHRLAELGVALHLLRGAPSQQLPDFLRAVGASLLVSDFLPLRHAMQWKADIARSIAIQHVEVDGHNIVPCRVASAKREVGAYTLRPKLRRLLGEFLTDLPPMPRVRAKSRGSAVDWGLTLQWLNPHPPPGDALGPAGGQEAAMGALRGFLGGGIHRYSALRNDPTANGQSGLSPYLHFGQIAPQRVAIEAIRQTSGENREAFLEELIVRRELADNYCLHCPAYDTPRGFPEWAQRTLSAHAADEREYLYSPTDLERGRTHDPLWNAAQRQLITTGRMHGYMRMYWAKKILEWTPSAEQAQRIAIALNDGYSLDGHDPNGYAGVAWSIGGAHDRPWGERPVFGKVRFMNYRGCMRKFDVGAYIRMHSPTATP